MNIANAPLKLKKYINKVEKQTRRKVTFEKRNDLWRTPGTAAFVDHPTEIRVILSPELDISDPNTEQLIAHEITHGLLIYARGYYNPNPAKSLSKTEADELGFLLTMIDDIVVNKLIQQEGFAPFLPFYLVMVERETKAALAGEDIYKEFTKERGFRSKFMVFRYITAWAFLEYFRLDKQTVSVLRQFISSFEKFYPNEFGMAGQIKELIKRNNIFNSKGHRIVVKKILELWQLSHLVKPE